MSLKQTSFKMSYTVIFQESLIIIFLSGNVSG